MSFSPSRSGSGSRSRSRSRSPRPRRRGTPRPISPSQSEGESHGGAGLFESQGSSSSKSSKVRDRKRRRSRSEDPDTPCRHTSQALVPLNYSRHAEEESSDTSEVDDEGQENDRIEGLDRSRSRSKKIRKVDVSNPLSTFRRQVRQRKRYLEPTQFVRDEWMGMRGMVAEGNFIIQKDNKTDEWKNVAKSDRLIKRYAGDIFAETRLDDGLHAIVDKDTSTEEKKQSKQQKTMGAIAHLSLLSMENYSTLYKKITNMYMWYIGRPETPNPAWKEGDKTQYQYIYNEGQNRAYAQLQEVQREFQVDLAEPLANIARIATASFTGSLEERRGKVISKIKRSNTKAASVISRIPPSAHFMFGGDHRCLAKVVELAKDLTSTADRRSSNTPRSKPKYKGGHGSGAGKSRGVHGGSSHGNGGRGGGSGTRPGGHKKRKPDTGNNSSSFRGGNSNRGGKN